MAPAIFNLLAELPAAGAQEQFDTLCETRGARIERIVSHGHASPPDFWYDQAHDEWVMVLQGEATLGFEGGAGVLLNAGDSLCIPAHCRHRVISTSQNTVWLAVHLPESGPSA